MKFYLITLLILTSACCIGCYDKPTITKDYVINPNWNETNNDFTIVRMKFKDDTVSISSNDSCQPDIRNKLIEDPNFYYTANVKYNGESYSKRKVYFNKDNGFMWWEWKDGSEWWEGRFKSGKRVLGELERNTWYLLAGLSQFKTLYYVYIDTEGEVHYFTVMASNW